MDNPNSPNVAPVATARARTIGAILVDSGRITAEGAEKILRLQKEQGLRFGDAAIKLKLVTEEDIQFALSRQFDYPYLAPGDESLSRELAAAYQPFGPTVEQLRALRSQLMLRWFDGAPERKAIAVVSPAVGDGRSFLAANLAIVFSQLGERTLIIDADLRSPRQHLLFNLRSAGGLSDILAGRAGQESIVRITKLLGLSVLPAGAVPPNPQELLGRSAFASLLERVSEEFDTVIIDTPAAMQYADAQTVAARAGAALLLARTDHTSSAELIKLSGSLGLSGISVVGTALNDG